MPIIETLAHTQGGLELHGIQNVNTIYWNLSTPVLVEEAVRRREGRLAHLGPLVVRTGQHTGRSPNDKFIVREPSCIEKVWWGKVNRPMEQDQWQRQSGQLQVVGFGEVFRQPEEEEPPDRISHEFTERKRPRLPVRQQVSPGNVDRRLGRVALNVGKFVERQAGMFFRPPVKHSPEHKPDESQRPREDESPLPTDLHSDDRDE
jgi:Phosphoenolpyruvate carboxykinase